MSAEDEWSSRTTADRGPPFSYCGVDIFGPFLVKEGRRIYKRCGAMFTCLCSRAVYIEATNSMTTDSFIQALRRLISRGANIRIIQSDNGSNFIGANTELKRAFSEMDKKKINNFLMELGREWLIWKHNPPTASNMGGLGEWQIRSARSILAALLKQHDESLNDESLRTLLVEVEEIINWRPITCDNISDMNSIVPLNPKQLLSMKTKIVMPPPGIFQKEDMYCWKYWRRVQHICNEFWTRRKKDVLLLFQKWNCTKRNFQVGEVVLVRDDSMRNKWQMARVITTYPNKKGIIRSVQLQLGKSSGKERTLLDRPVNKLVWLIENEKCY